jgi:hypothetical protein
MIIEKIEEKDKLRFGKMEEYRNIPGYEGKYEVSNIGNVKSLDRLDSLGRRVKGRIIKTNIIDGYKALGLSNGKTKGVRVHVLVAMAFLNHTPNGKVINVDHINENKLDNRVVNLQIITKRDNVQKSKKGCYSIYDNVTYDKRRHKWYGKIRYNGKTHCFAYRISEYRSASDVLKFKKKHNILPKYKS